MAIKWYKIADHENEIDFGENGMTVIEVKGKKMTAARNGEGVYVFAYRCPHAGGQLSEGWLDPLGNVVCPLHRYKFCLKNGRNVSGEGYYLKHWPVEQREDGIYVGMEESSFWNFLG